MDIGRRNKAGAKGKMKAKLQPALFRSPYFRSPLSAPYWYSIEPIDGNFKEVKCNVC